MSTVYVDRIFGKAFKFNDVVQCRWHKVPGRLVQVRKGVGQYGSDIFLIRRACGNLIALENTSLEESDAQIPIEPEDNIDVEYTSFGGYPETGFIIEKPQQPMSDSPPFAIIITKEESENE